MARPSLKRALLRAGLAPRAKEDRPKGVAPPPRCYLPGEPVVPNPPPLDLAALFGRPAPVELEIGPGRARFLLAEAEEHPDRSFLGAELEEEYARIAQARADRRRLANVRFACLDGKELVLRRLPPASLAALHVYFPDPWPKKRHWKRRLFDARFASAAARALGPDALLRVASDHAGYFSVIKETLDAEPGLEPVSEAEAGAWTPGTNYETKFRKEGRPIFSAGWRRRAAEEPPPAPPPAPARRSV
jgi:tRNA (guanine-N7-)-methyltransferase